MEKNMELIQPIFDLDGKKILYIDPNTVYTDSFINFFGENTISIANFLNENNIKLVQNFYSDVPPEPALFRMKWLNKVNNKFYEYNGYNWQQIEKDKVSDVFMYRLEYKDELYLPNSIFNLGFNNLKLFDDEFNELLYSIDTYDNRKIILKYENVSNVYAVLFHPNDIISNFNYNEKVEFVAESGQTQFDITTLKVEQDNVYNISVVINDVVLKYDEFYVENGILNINGRYYNLSKGDIVKVYKNGGSFEDYHTNIKFYFETEVKKFKIYKFFNRIEEIKIVDVINKQIIEPIDIVEYSDYFEVEIFSDRLIKADIKVRVI
jgi:hypothetical protein